MSRPPEAPARKPLIALVDRAHRALQTHMVREANARGDYPIKHSHNAVFARLPFEGARAADMAALAGITRQSMGEIVREMVEMGLLEMVPDPQDGRAKLVRYTAEGMEFAKGGYRHLVELEELFAQEFGHKEYEVVRDVLDRLVGLLEEIERPTT